MSSIVDKIKVILRRIKRILKSFVFRNFLTRKLENKIVFFTTQGTYTCNAKAICEEIIKRKLPYKLVWVVNKYNIENKESLKEYPKQLKLVVKGTNEFYKEIYTSKIWIDNEHNFGRRFRCNKKKGMLLLNTFHGSMGLKKIGIPTTKSQIKTVKTNIKYQRQVDYCISNSKFENEVYRNSYWKENPILEIGHARNDILLKNKNSKEIKDIYKKVYNFLNIKPNTKIFLYAPTFRKDKNDSIINKLDFKKIKEALVKKWGGNWEIVVRFHEVERLYHLDFAKKNNLIDATNYPNMQELLVVADVGLTDYSSWICDYVLTNHYGFLFTPDLKKYGEEERGFYYPLTETPFPIAMTSEELVKNILDFDNKKYEKNKKEFLEKRGCFEKGNASEIIVDKIEEFIKEN